MAGKHSTALKPHQEEKQKLESGVGEAAVGPLPKAEAQQQGEQSPLVQEMIDQQKVHNNGLGVAFAQNSRGRPSGSAEEAGGTPAPQAPTKVEEPLPSRKRQRLPQANTPGEVPQQARMRNNRGSSRTTWSIDSEKNLEQAGAEEGSRACSRSQQIEAAAQKATQIHQRREGLQTHPGSQKVPLPKEDENCKAQKNQATKVEESQLEIGHQKTAQIRGPQENDAQNHQVQAASREQRVARKETKTPSRREAARGKQEQAPGQE